MHFDLDQSRQVLERTPATLQALLRGLSDAWVTGTEGPESWSPYDIVGHMLHGEKTDWMARAEIILTRGDDVRFEPYDRFAQFRESQGRPLDELLADFASQRRHNLDTLAGWALTEEQLDWTGEHPAFGVVTLRQLLSTWVAHDLGHLAQITRVMAKQYREAVGPWRAYLPVMDR